MSVGRNRIKEFGQESKRCQASSNIPEWRGSPMTDFSTSPRVRLLSITLVTLLVLSPLVAPLGVGPIGTASAADGVHYVTDSGFEVADASDGADPRSGNPFSDPDTLELPDITLSSSGAASVTLDQRTGTFTNLTNVDDDPSITVTPDDKQAIALLGGFDSLNVSDVDYDSSSSDVDLVYSTDSETTAAVRIESTGLDTGDTVEALDVDTGTVLDTTAVDGDGSVSFSELAAGAHSVNLREEVTTGSSSSGGGGGGSGSSTVAEDGEASVTVTETTETGDSSGEDGGEDGETPDTTVSVSNPQPGQTLIIENGRARIVDADVDPEDDADAGADGDADTGQADGADGGTDADGADGDGASNVRADRLSVDLNTDQDFTLSVTTYENDLTRSSAAGQPAQSALAPPPSGAVGAVDASIAPRGEPPELIAQTDAPDTVRTAAESFEAETDTVSAGYVDVEHTLGDGAIAGATFEFSIRRAYLEELGVEPEGVTLYHRLDGEWETRETEYADGGETYHRFEGTMPEFSVFALGTGAATIEPTAATIDAGTIDVGAEATVTATVTNRGQTTGEDSIELTLDGDVVATETVTLDGGESRNVSFTVAPDAPGEYDLAVGALDLEPLAVEEPGQEQPEEADGSPPWGIIAIAVVLVLVLGIVALRQR